MQYLTNAGGNTPAAMTFCTMELGVKCTQVFHSSCSATTVNDGSTRAGSASATATATATAAATACARLAALAALTALAVLPSLAALATVANYETIVFYNISRSPDSSFTTVHQTLACIIFCSFFSFPFDSSQVPKFQVPTSSN